MTEEQLNLLRDIIQREISFALSEGMDTFYRGKECEELWKTLKESFDKEERRKKYEVMLKELHKPQENDLNYFNRNWSKEFQKLQEEFGND